MFRNLMQVTTVGLSLFCLSACLEYDVEGNGISTRAVGLTEGEEVQVSVKSQKGAATSVTLEGNSTNVSETKRFSISVSENIDARGYSAWVSRNPVNSNKVCRVTNPEGFATASSTIIRVQCGYQIVVTNPNGSDVNSAVLVSNGFQTLALSDETRRTTNSVRHDMVPVLSSDGSQRVDSDGDLMFDVVTQQSTSDTSPHPTVQAITFSELYSENDPAILSLTSTIQGCQLIGADDSGSFNQLVDSESLFSFTPTDTLKTVPATLLSSQSNDWLVDPVNRKCSDYDNGPITYSYAKTENTTGTTGYDNDSCFPSPAINLVCGTPLKLYVAGISLDMNESLLVSASIAGSNGTSDITPNGTSPTVASINNTHDMTFEDRGIYTFNLPFETSENYSLNIEESFGVNRCRLLDRPTPTETVSLDVSVRSSASTVSNNIDNIAPLATNLNSNAGIDQVFCGHPFNINVSGLGITPAADAVPAVPAAPPAPAIPEIPATPEIPDSLTVSYYVNGSFSEDIIISTNGESTDVFEIPTGNNERYNLTIKDVVSNTISRCAFESSLSIYAQETPTDLRIADDTSAAKPAQDSIVCGYNLYISVSGINNSNESATVSISRNGTPIQTLTFGKDQNGKSHTVGLPLLSEDGYSISIDNESNLSCNFISTGSQSATGEADTSNITESLACS